MREFVLLLAVLPLLIFAKGNCTFGVGQGRLPPCGQLNVILMDSTVYMRTKENGDQLLKYMETLFSAYKIDEQNQVGFSLQYYSDTSADTNGFGVYGGNTPEGICSAISGIQQYHIDATVGNYTLSSIFSDPLYKDYHYDHLILFTATTDQVDIYNTGKKLTSSSASFTVIKMGSTADFSSWPNTRVIDIPLQFPFPDYLAELIINTQCGYQVFAGDNCTVGQGRHTPCVQQIVIITDSTLYMGTKENADQLLSYMGTLLSAYKIDDQSQIVANLGYYADSKAQYGIGGLWAGFTPGIICKDLSAIQQWHKEVTMGNCKLSSQMNWYFDNVILFTATTDQEDIDDTGKKLASSSASFTVIKMGSTADFSSWPNTRVIDIPLQFPFPDYLAELIINTQCGYQDSTTAGWDSPSQGVTTTESTFPPTIQPTAQPSKNCPCNPSKSWNDVFLLFDGSNGMAANRFEELVDYVFSAMGQLTIGQGEQYQTRTGIIIYGDQSQLFANLDYYTNTDDFVDDIDNVTRTNTDGTNIDGAISMAIDSFKSSAHRSTSRKVIIIGASTYKLGNYESPLAKAKTFKDNGGIIIVIAFGDSNGNVAPELKEIASPEYYIDSSKSVAKVQDLIDLICSANCFCPSSYTADSTTHRGDPNDGCYQTSTLEATNQLAKHYCSREHQGKLSTVITPAQQIFVSKDVSGKEPIYVGLERSYSQWIWADGTTFNGVINDKGGDCATLTRVKGFKTEFDSAQCKLPYLYSCQATPCSTEVFCTQF